MTVPKEEEEIVDVEGVKEPQGMQLINIPFYVNYI